MMRLSLSFSLSPAAWLGLLLLVVMIHFSVQVVQVHALADMLARTSWWLKQKSMRDFIRQSHSRMGRQRRGLQDADSGTDDYYYNDDTVDTSVCETEFDVMAECMEQAVPFIPYNATTSSSLTMEELELNEAAMACDECMEDADAIAIEQFEYDSQFPDFVVMDCAYVHNLVCMPIDSCACLAPCATEWTDVLDCQLAHAWNQTIMIQQEKEALNNSNSTNTNSTDYVCEALTCVATNVSRTDDKFTSATPDDDFVSTGICSAQEAAVKTCVEAMLGTLADCYDCLQSSGHTLIVDEDTTCDDLVSVTCLTMSACPCVADCANAHVELLYCDFATQSEYPVLQRCPMVDISVCAADGSVMEEENEGAVGSSTSDAPMGAISVSPSWLYFFSGNAAAAAAAAGGGGGMVVALMMVALSILHLSH